MSVLKNIKNKSVTDKIIEQLIEGIIKGEFMPGTKIPTEQELVMNMGVSRNSVREAIKILVSYGVLEIRRPDGTFVCKEYNNQMLNPLVYGLIIGNDLSGDIVLVRRIVDIGILIAVMDKITDADMQLIETKLDILIDSIKKGVENIDDILNADIEFHNSIEAVLKNPLVSVINEMITKITLYSRKSTIEKNISSGEANFMIESHIKIVKALKNKDYNNIVAALDDSYLSWKETVREVK